MAKKTNKTSHVMDLLTNGSSPEAEETAEESVTSGQEKKTDVQSHSVTPAKVTVVDEGSINDRVSQEILGKLTEELAEEGLKEESESAAPGETPALDLPEPDVQADAGAITEESSTPDPVSDAPEASQTDPLPAVEESQAPAGTEPSEAQKEVLEPAPKAEEEPKKEPHPIIPESHFGSHTKNREYRFVNVMEQLLMRQDLEAVLKQHSVCTCPRCMSDVCALALTGLPSKYVVTSKDSISPLLSYYENKYKIPVLTELMLACNKVRENPRHKK